MISWELTLGNLLTILTMGVVCITFVMAIKGRLDLLNQSLNIIDRRLTAVENAVSLIGQATIQLAKQEVRLDVLTKEIENLKQVSSK
jgi:hypothetical protein